jgi:hypothetical protein
MLRFTTEAFERRLVVAESSATSKNDVTRIWRMREGLSKSLQMHGAPPALNLCKFMFLSSMGQKSRDTFDAL